MNDESTLGGYLEKHGRPPAFEGKDGAAYSVSIITSDEKEDAGYGAALLFVRWSPEGDRPVGHLETDYLVFGESFARARNELENLSLHDVKRHLDTAIDGAGETF